MGFPSIGDRVKFGRFRLGISRSALETYTPNLSTFMGLEPLEKVPGGGWVVMVEVVVVLEFHFSVQLKPKGSLQKKKKQKYIGLLPILGVGGTPDQYISVFFLGYFPGGVVIIGKKNSFTFYMFLNI